MSGERSGGVLGWVGFLVTVPLFIFVSTKAGVLAVGAGLVVGALSQWRQPRIAYGWDGQPPRGFITGWPAKVILIFTAALGVAVLIWPEVAMGMLGLD